MSDRTSRDAKRRVLEEVGVYVSTPLGKSMRPMLRGGKDNILVEKPAGRLKKYDVALYTRADGTSVLHRVVKVRENDYAMRGDNCDYTEYGITDDDLVGVMTGFWRGERFVSADSRRYRLYIRLNHATYPLRWLRIKTGKLLRKIASHIPPLRRLWRKLRGK
ncbi:MAG: S24/S26 family peptidase [Clostridia bacterium]|nr:S24/S26 family peptidase [Clostridia bacterium]